LLGAKEAAVKAGDVSILTGLPTTCSISEAEADTPLSRSPSSLAQQYPALFSQTI
jgi:hypothetical protein